MNEKYMKRAIELAAMGKGYTNPNPLVGAVIVKNDQIIGEGYHKVFGGPHAEINAFSNAKQDVKGATMYVTLEPCSHYGKTPPCADAIIDKGIAKVVIGMRDPNELVAGRGIERLRKHGIEVIEGVMQDEVRKLNEIFIKYITAQIPFCIMKSAMTLDGKIATKTGDSKWITNEESRKYVHELRHQVSSIMVGIGTVLADDPSLTTRLKNLEGIDATRVIVDTYGRISLDANVLNLRSNAKTIIATTDNISKEKIRQLEQKDAEVLVLPLKDNQVDLKELMKELGKKGIDSVLLEGGGTLNWSALNEQIVDKVLAFIAPKIIGGKQAKTPVQGDGVECMKKAICLNDISIKQFEEDIMIQGYVRKEEGNICSQD